MDSKSQSQLEYLLATAFALIITVTVLFVVFSFASHMGAAIRGKPAAAEPLISISIREEARLPFIAGIVGLYLLEHGIFLFFYRHIAKQRPNPKGERKMASKVFKFPLD